MECDVGVMDSTPSFQAKTYHRLDSRYKRPPIACGQLYGGRQDKPYHCLQTISPNQQVRMKPFSLLGLVASFAGVCSANFDLYIQIATFYNGPDFSQVQRQWAIYESNPSCGQAVDQPWYYDSDDVSGATGVRCSGSGCDPTGAASDITELEMNLGFGNSVWHWSKLNKTPCTVNDASD